MICESESGVIWESEGCQADARKHGETGEEQPVAPLDLRKGESEATWEKVKKNWNPKWKVDRQAVAKELSDGGKEQPAAASESE